MSKCRTCDGHGVVVSVSSTNRVVYTERYLCYCMADKNFVGGDHDYDVNGNYNTLVDSDTEPAELAEEWVDPT